MRTLGTTAVARVPRAGVAASSGGCLRAPLRHVTGVPPTPAGTTVLAAHTPLGGTLSLNYGRTGGGRGRPAVVPPGNRRALTVAVVITIVLLLLTSRCIAVSLLRHRCDQARCRATPPLSLNIQLHAPSRAGAAQLAGVSGRQVLPGPAWYPLRVYGVR